MGNYIFAYEADFIPISAITAVSEATGRDVENATTYTRPNRLYIGSGAYASERIVIDFGSQTTVDGLFLDNVNCNGTSANITVQGNATDSWGAPPFSSGTQSDGSANPWGRDRMFIDLSGGTFSSTGYRYMRLVPGGTATDGSGVLKIGGILPVASFTTWTENMGFPFDVELFEPVNVQARVGAPAEVSILGDKRFVVQMSQSSATSNLDANAKELLSVGQGQHMLFYRNNSTLRESYLFRRTSRNSLSQTAPNARALQNVLFEEVA